MQIFVPVIASECLLSLIKHEISLLHNFKMLLSQGYPLFIALLMSANAAFNNYNKFILCVDTSYSLR